MSMNVPQPDLRIEVDVSGISGYEWLCFGGERLRSGDGEGKTLLTRQIAHEPLPASVLFVFGGRQDVRHGLGASWSMVGRMSKL